MKIILISLFLTMNMNNCQTSNQHTTANEFKMENEITHLVESNNIFKVEGLLKAGADM